jgi:hypothetical protein
MIMDRPVPAGTEHPPSAYDVLVAALRDTDSERLPVAALIAAFKERGFGFLLFVFALPNCVPMPPGVGSALGIPVALLAVQMVLGFRSPWLPAWLLKKTIPRAPLLKGLEGFEPRIRSIERLLHPRYERVFDWLGERGIGLIVGVLAAAILLPAPFTNFILSISVVMIALAVIEQDGGMLGLGVLAGLASIAVTLVVSASFLAGVWFGLQALLN